MATFVPFIRVTHSGLYADGRPNTSPVFLTDVNFGFVQQNRKDPAYVPPGGSIDVPYTSWGAFSFEQGDIFNFQQAGLVTAELVGVVPPIATNQYFYQDNPGADGAGTYAQSYAVLVPEQTLGQLHKVTVRQDFPAAAGESASIRLFRYRKASAFGAFFIDQITSTFVLDSADPWSWTIDISANILPGFLLNWVTDMVAISNVYVPGGGPTMRALRVDFQVSVVESSIITQAPSTPGVMTWPPS